MIRISSNGARRRYSKRWFAVLGVFAAVFLFTFLVGRSKVTNESVDAASLANFDPGYIISDYQMSDYNSMNEAEIQAFLTSKNSCPNRDYNYYLQLSAGSVAKWHFENGHFICLSEEKFGDGETIGTGETAAHIIWQTAQDFKINPKVILVLLQKETSLITDPIPNNYDYRKAVGYGCPDTAACSSTYYGFKNQVRNAAALFRTVLDGGWTNYPLGNNYIQYNPNAGCGGSVVNVRSLATSALYRYTPYQPNPGAIAAGYGTAPCGAYGNRNFYLYFQDWFGGIMDEKKEPEEIIIEAPTKYERPIEDGFYQISSKAFPDKVIDIKGGVYPGMTNGLLQIYPKKDENAENQIFEIKYDETNGYYFIKNTTTGSVFDVKGVNSKNGTPVQIFAAHEKCNQDWLFERDNDGYYTIVSRCSSKILDASLSSGFVNIFLSHGGDNQKWKMTRIDDQTTINGKYQIFSKAFPDKVIDIKGGVYPGMTNGLLQIYPKKDENAENQIFEIKPGSKNGHYVIINSVTGLVVDVKGARIDDGTPTQVFGNNGACNQDWIIERTEDGYNKIISGCSGKILDASLSSGFVNIFLDHDGDNQKWQLISQ